MKSSDFLIESVQNTSELLAPLIFPPVCVLCGELTGDALEGEGSHEQSSNSRRRFASFCRVCETALVQSAPAMRSACERCAWPAAGHVRPSHVEDDPEGSGDADVPDALPCPECVRRQTAFSFKSVTAIYRYHEVVRHAIIAAKYPRNTAIARELAVRLADRYRAGEARLSLCVPDDTTDAEGESDQSPMVTHVPSPFWRQFRRGGVGTGSLASRFAREMNFWFGSLLETTRSVQKQALLDDEARRENVRGAFRVRRRWRKRVSGRNVLLVDDVMTTGATADEISRVLLDAGAARVDLLVVARAIRDAQK
ncbi:ComF family protein [Rhodopirellula bahusiensis]|uniref:Phosphoribosyl transferase n=1 Tax=Rhodopirellula bahusiensis TaxID=2014065 RepID=A0A2G1WDL3_9BACT|nr:phosphoribosyltransferase family protein [Rhodopirellula bahusiensis]PHQ37108.1 phosphoribosyl transferase [Rhodopirellula bahusiensis]